MGKTGTTSDDFDRWFVGLTPYYVTSVWWGYDKAYGEGGHSLERWSSSGRTNIPVNVWKYLMEQVQADLPVKQFPDMPEGVEIKQACAVTGDLLGPGCTSSMESYYTPTAVPQICSGSHLSPEEQAALIEQQLALEAAAAAAAA